MKTHCIIPRSLTRPQSCATKHPVAPRRCTASRPAFAFLLLGILLPFLALAAPSQTLYQTSFEPPAFTPGLPIRGQDGWAMFSDGEAISVSTSNANTGTQCLRFEGSLLEPQASGSSIAVAWLSPASLTNITGGNPPLIVEIQCDVRLDGPQVGTAGTPDLDKLSANFLAGSDTAYFGEFIVSSAGKIWTSSAAPGESYKYSLPSTFGTYRTLTLRVDFIARTLTYLVDGVELGTSPINPSNTDQQLTRADLAVSGPTDPIHTPEIDYDPANYTAYYDNYRISAVPIEGARTIVEQPAGNRLFSGAGTVDFGSRITSSGGVQRTFTLRNPGNADLTAVAVTIDGAHATDFTVTASPAATVPAGGSTTFTVTFSPTALGARTAALHVISAGDPFNIALTGTGLAPDEIAQQAYLKASNTETFDFFGTVVALDGDTIVVGAPNEDSNATGVNGNQSNNSAADSGAVYIFVRNGTDWVQQAYLKASNTEPINPPSFNVFRWDFFGSSVAISGDTVVVGAPSEGSNATGVNGDQSDNSASGAGAVYVFVREGTNWTQQAYLKASNTGGIRPGQNFGGDNFGTSVSVSGDTIIVGAPSEDSNATGVNGDQSNNSATNSGAAYVFVREGTNWTQQAYLKASNTGAEDSFGFSVSASDDTVVVAALNEDTNATGVNGNQTDNSTPGAGAAYVFVREGTTWTQQAYLKASNTEAGDYFGYSVSISGDTIMVGAPYESSNATGVNGNQNNNSSLSAGAAYIFVREGTNWTQQAYLKASNTGAEEYFGFPVAISGDSIVVGASYESSNATGVNGNQNSNSAESSGAAYVFVREGTNWTQQAYLKASNTGGPSPSRPNGDNFGYSVAVSGGTVVVGAWEEDSNATGVNGNQNNNSAGESGAAYVFTGLAVPRGPTIDTQPVPQNVLIGTTATFTVSATTTNPPLSYQWRFNGANLPGANSASLIIANAQVANLGAYQVVVTDSVGSLRSAVVRLDLIDALFVTTQPADVAVRAGSNATFTVAVYGTAPLRAQWQFNGADLANATNLVLTIPNVQAAQLGNYAVVITNQYGAVTSTVATLTFPTPPTIIAPPQPVTVTAGESATFTVTVTNTATLPITYSWRKGSTVITNILLHARTCSFTLFNVQTNVTITNGPGNYRVVVQNVVNPSPGLASSLAALTVLPAPPRPIITGYTLLVGGGFQLQFSGAAGTAYTILASTNLLDWTSLGAPTATAPGQFEFTDTQDPAPAQRFYRVKQD